MRLTGHIYVFLKSWNLFLQQLLFTRLWLFKIILIPVLRSVFYLWLPGLNECIKLYIGKYSFLVAPSVCIFDTSRRKSRLWCFLNTLNDDWVLLSW